MLLIGLKKQVTRFSFQRQGNKSESVNASMNSSILDSLLRKYFKKALN